MMIVRLMIVRLMMVVRLSGHPLIQDSLNLFSAATSETSTHIDRAQGDEETDDVATSKAGTILQS